MRGRNVDLYIILLILVAIFVFNFESIFGAKFLFLDDQARFFSVPDFTRSSLFFGKHGPFYYFFRLPAITLLGYSVFHARLFVFLVYMVPLSLIFYFFCRKQLGFEPVFAMGVAIVPFILPQQMLLPAFVDGSYMILGLLLIFISISLAVNFFGRSKFGYIYWFLSLLFFYFSLKISELAILVLPPILYFFWAKHGWVSKVWILAIPIIILAAFRLYWVLFDPRPNSVIVMQSFSNISERFSQFIQFFGPYSDKVTGWISGGFGFLNFFLILGGLFIPFIRWSRTKKLTIGDFSREPLIPILFSVLWILSTGLVFVFYSKYFSVRYLFFAGFGFSLLAISFLRFCYLQFVHVSKIKASLIVGVLLIAIPIFGINRSLGQRAFFLKYNLEADRLANQLQLRSYPEKSQIIIDGKLNSMAYGHYIWASGYLQHLLGRFDVHGNFLADVNLIDPLDTLIGRDYSLKGSGLSVNEPIFLFRYRKSALKPMFYFLRWKDPGSLHSSYWIYHLDSITGFAKCVRSGVGYQSYLNNLDSLGNVGVEQAEILFGGPILKKDSLRFKITL